jgi:hypothetical protein
MTSKAIKIDKKIVNYSIAKDEPAVDKPIEAPQQVIVNRPVQLDGSTYKIKQPTHDHALYVTINDYDNKPFEIFLNSKDVEHHQWTSALTRVISAVFRKGGDVGFLAEELKSIVDPCGKGYFKKGKYIPSLVAEIGMVLEQHLDSKKEVIEPNSTPTEVTVEESNGEFPPEATLCKKCNHKSVVILDGCKTCLNCGDSKCG